MTLVNKLHPNDLDRIHIQRMDHAFSQLVQELTEIENPVVNYVLRRWSITVFSDSVGINYPQTARQILERELCDYKAKAGKKKPKGKSGK